MGVTQLDERAGMNAVLPFLCSARLSRDKLHVWALPLTGCDAALV